MDKDITTALLCPSCRMHNSLELRTCVECGQPLALARARYYLDDADTRLAAGRYDQARSSLGQADVEMAAISSEERRSNLLTARAFWLQSSIYYYNRQTAEAQAELLLAVQSLEGIAGGESLLARVLNQLGNIAGYEERNTEAADYYLRSSEVAIADAEYATAATALSNIGLIRAEEGQHDEAMAWYTQAMAQSERSNDLARRADTYRLAADWYADQGPYTLAFEYIGKALGYYEQINRLDTICRVTYAAAGLYLRYGDLEQAEHWSRLLDETPDYAGYKLIYDVNSVLLSDIMRAKGDYDAAHSYANRAYSQINLAPNERGSAALALALCYVERGDWSLASRYTQRLEEICAAQAPLNDHCSLARAHTMLAAAQGKWEEAEQRFNEAMNLVRQQHKNYEIANLQEEYARRLLANHAIRDNLAIQTRAFSLLTEVAATWQEMEMPLRHARVVAML